MMFKDEKCVLSTFLKLALAFFCLSLYLCAPRTISAAEPTAKTTVWVVEMDGIVGVPLEEHVARTFDEIGHDGNSVLIFKIDTPGGLVDSMSAIVTRIAESDVPVVVWVAPSGSRAASAGAFIVQAAHVAAMAPGTNIGAAHPVTGGGKDIDNEEMKRKVTNDLTAKIRSFAQERGRDAEVAESMVAESISLTAREALDKNVIDMIASDEDDLIKQLNGRVVKTKKGDVKIDLDSYEVRRIEMSARLKALELFSRPDIAYVALIAGIFLILLELKSPGGFVMGLCGGLLLLVASYGLRVLPVNLAGLALLAGGVVVIAIDLAVGGMGLLAAAGIGAMLFGGLILFRAPGGELLHLSAGFIVGVTLVIGVVFLFIMRLIYKALRNRPVSGREGMIGKTITICDTSGAMPVAMVHGEYWRVRSVDELIPLNVGDEAEIVRVDSLTLYVHSLMHDKEENK